MENLKEINQFDIQVQNTSSGLITTLKSQQKQSVKDAVVFDEKVLFASDVEDSKYPFSSTFVLVGEDGQVSSYVEENGIMPTLFLSPIGEAYVSIVPYDPDKEMEITVPLFNREQVEIPKGNRPFLGDFIGCIADYSLFFDVNLWDARKQDKLFAIEFKGAKVKKKHNTKIPFPNKNAIYVDKDEIHLLAGEGEFWLHRLISVSGSVLKERKINPTHTYFSKILKLSFEEDSYVLQERDNSIYLDVISPEGIVEEQFLFDNIDSFYNTWPAVKIDKDTFVIRFNGEFGNGWFTIAGRELLEFFYSKGVQGYKNLITGEQFTIDLPDLIIHKIVKTKDSAYGILLSPSSNASSGKDTVVVLQRNLR